MPESTDKKTEAARFFALHFGAMTRDEIDRLVSTLWCEYRRWDEITITAGVDPARDLSALDIGGGFTTVLRIVPARYRVVVDICVPEMIAAGLALPADIEFIEGEAETLPFPSQSFTHVFCSNALDHFENPAKALAEMSRVLLPDGFCVVAVDEFPQSKGRRDILHPHGFTRADAFDLLAAEFDIVSAFAQPSGGKVGFHRLAAGDREPRADKSELIFVLRN